MTEPQLRELRAKLYERSWTDDEIRDRVMIHSSAEGKESRSDQPSPSRESTPPPSWHPPETLEVDPDDPVGRATERAVRDLAEIGRDPAARIVERTLANALAACLDGAEAERKVPVPGWRPEPGNVDVVTRDWRGRPKIVIETKLKEDDKLGEILWDAPKLLSIATQDSIQGAYLVVGSTVANWDRSPIGAQFLDAGRHSLVEEIERHRDYWTSHILAGGSARPLRVPEHVTVAQVGRVALDMRGQRWEVRASRIEISAGTPWRAFRDGLPEPA